jgi:hypothetical protein
VPLRRGQMFPVLPAGGLMTLEDGQALPGAHVIDREIVYPGIGPGVYAYIVQTAHRNLYRLTVP